MLNEAEIPIIPIRTFLWQTFVFYYLTLIRAKLYILNFNKNSKNILNRLI